LAEITVGLLFWMWRPGNIVGPLLIIYVFLIVLSDDVPNLFPHSRFESTFGDLGWLVYLGVYVWMLLAFPTGRLWNRASFWLIVWMGIVFLAAGIPGALWTTPKTYLYVGNDASAYALSTKIFAVLFVVNWAILSGFLIVRIVRAAPGARWR